MASETFAGIVEIIKNIVLWLLGKRERKQQHAQDVAESEQKLNNAVDNGHTIGELSEAVEDLKQQHKL